MRLLVAEDEVELAKGLKYILEAKHFSVDIVSNGEEALYYAQTIDFDGIILDIMMPKLSGLEVLQQLRAAGNQTPILLLTARSQLEDKVSGLDLGADDYLTKPFDMPELLARVRSMLRRQPTFLDSTLVYGDIELDRQTYELRIKGKTDATEVLNNREFQLLELLMLNTQQLLSKETIMERIWGLDSDAEINVVWVNISSLRKRLQKLNSTVQISAVRGLGYKLNEQASGDLHD